MKLPEWAQQMESYEPDKDREVFLSRSLLHISSLLFRLRSQSHKNSNAPAAMALLFVLCLTILTALSRSSGFLLCVLTGELLALCFLPGLVSRQILLRALGASLMSLVLTMPSLFLGWSPAIVLIPCRTFLTVTALCLLTSSLSWHALIASLRFYHTPEIMIAILDLTLKYIVLLGTISQEMLYALKLRHIGKLPGSLAFGGLIGTVALRARTIGKDMYQAMICRGFTGEYPRQTYHWNVHDSFFLAATLLLLALYFYFARFTNL